MAAEKCASQAEKPREMVLGWEKPQLNDNAILLVPCIGVLALWTFEGWPLVLAVISSVLVAIGSEDWRSSNAEFGRWTWGLDDGR